MDRIYAEILLKNAVVEMAPGLKVTTIAIPFQSLTK